MSVIKDIFWQTEQGLKYVKNEERYKNEIYFPAFVLSKCSKGSFNKYLDEKTGIFSDEKIEIAYNKAYKEEKNWLMNKLTGFFEDKCKPTGDCNKNLIRQKYKSDVYEEPFEIYSCIENATFSFQKFKEGKSCKLKPHNELKNGGITYFSLPHLRATYFDLLGIKDYLTIYMVKYNNQLFERFYGTDVDGYLYLPEAFTKILITKVFPTMIRQHLSQCVKINRKESQSGGGETDEQKSARDERARLRNEEKKLLEKEQKEAQELLELEQELIKAGEEEIQKREIKKARISKQLKELGPLEEERKQELKKVQRKVDRSLERKYIQQEYLRNNVQKLLNTAMNYTTDLVDYTVDEGSGKIIGKIGDAVVGTASFLGSSLGTIGNKLRIIFYPPKDINPLFLKKEYEQYNSLITDITTCCLSIKSISEKEKKRAIKKLMDTPIEQLTYLKNRILIKDEPTTILESAIIQDEIKRKNNLTEAVKNLGESLKTMSGSKGGEKYELMSQQLDGTDSLNKNISSINTQSYLSDDSSERMFILQKSLKDMASAMNNVVNTLDSEWGPTQSYDDYEEYTERLETPSNKQEFIADENPFWQSNIHKISLNINKQSRKDDIEINNLLDNLNTDELKITYNEEQKHNDDQKGGSNRKSNRYYRRK